MIPTAEEFCKQFRKTNPIAEAESIEHWMGQHCIAFTKLHVKAALISVTKLDLDDVTVMPDANDFEEGRELHILNAYPNNLII